MITSLPSLKVTVFFICLCVLVSFRGQNKLGPCPNLSRISDKHPCPLYMEVPPPPPPVTNVLSGNSKHKQRQPKHSLAVSGSLRRGPRTKLIISRLCIPPSPESYRRMLVDGLNDPPITRLGFKAFQRLMPTARACGGHQRLWC